MEASIVTIADLSFENVLSNQPGVSLGIQYSLIQSFDPTRSMHIYGNWQKVLSIFAEFAEWEGLPPEVIWSPLIL